MKSLSKYNLISLPNLDELLFLYVLAFPKDSNIGLQFNILFSKEPNYAKNFIHNLAFSVLPAPLSPLIMIVYGLFTHSLNASLAIPNICGGNLRLV